MRCFSCEREMRGFECSCGWRRTSRTFLREREEETMEGVSLLVPKELMGVMWFSVPAGSMVVVDDEEV